MSGRNGPERRGPERPGPDYPAEWDREPTNDEPCMCGTPFTCMAEDHDAAVAVGTARAEAIATVCAKFLSLADDIAANGDPSSRRHYATLIRRTVKEANR